MITHTHSCEFVTSNSAPLPSFTAVLSTAISLSTGALWLGTDNGLYQATLLRPSSLYIVDDDLFYNGDILVNNVSEVNGRVRTLLWRSAVSGDAKQHAAFKMLPGSVNVHQKGLSYSTSGSVYGSTGVVESSMFGVLVVGTEERLYFHNGESWWFEWVSVWGAGLGGVVDGPPTDMTVGTSGEIYIANNISLTRLNTNYTFDRIGPLQGLPYNQLKSLCFINYHILEPHPSHAQFSVAGAMWVGTGKGYTLLDLHSSKFKGYFYGPRWHSGEEIQAIASIGGAGVVMVTDAGLTFVTPEAWTLAKKAEHYQRMLSRHTREPGEPP